MATYQDVQNQQQAQAQPEPFTIEKAMGMQAQQAQEQQFATEQAMAEQANARNAQDAQMGGAGQVAEIPAGMQHGGPGNVQQNPQPQGPPTLDQMPPELAQAAMGVAQEMQQSQQMAQEPGLGVPPGYA